MSSATNILICDAFIDCWPEYLLRLLDPASKRNVSIVQVPDIETLYACAERCAPDLIMITMNNAFVRGREATLGRGDRVAACAIISDLKRRYGAPVFAFTGWMPELNRALAGIFGADYFSVLPFDAGEFDMALSRHVEKG